MLKTLSNFGLSREHYIVMAVETFNALGWEHTFIAPTGCKALAWQEQAEPDGSILNIPTEIWIEIPTDTPRLQVGPYAEVTTTAATTPPITYPSLDQAAYENYIDQYTDKFIDVYPNYNLGQLDEKWKVLEKAYFKNNPTYQAADKPRRPTFAEMKQRLIKPFIPTEKTWMTNIIFYSNVVIYVLMVLLGVHFWNPTPDALLAWGANNKELVIQNGEWWRLLSSCFLHVGLLHLVFNMYALVLLSFFVEPFIGRWRYLIAYIASGIAGSAISIYWNDWITVSAGASGAISGVAGLLMVLLLFQFLGKQASRLLFIDMLVMVGLNFFIGFAENIDNAAHAGGFVAGAVFGLIYALTMKEELKTYEPEPW